VETLHQRGVVVEGLARSLGLTIGVEAPLHRVETVAAGCDVELVEIGAGLDRVEDELEKRVVSGGRQDSFDFFGARDEILPLGEHALGLTVVHEAEGAWLDQLGFAAAVELGVAVDECGDLGGVGRAELPRGPLLGELADAFIRPLRGGPSVGEEILDGELHRLEVADVDDPDARGVVLPGKVHLLPYFREWIGVEPLVVSRAADVVEVVVDAGAAGACALGRGGQAADIAPVVIAPEERDVVGHAHAALVVVLDFLVERPDLRDFRDVGIDLLGEDRALIGDDFFEEGDIGVFRHGLVAVAAHGEGDDAFEVAVAADAVGPELAQRFAIGGVVPVAGAVTGPLLL